MKSKKAIFEWWQNLGRKEEQGNDLYDFYQSIEIPYTEKIKDITREIILCPKNCKYPLYLSFWKCECVRIIGF